METSTGALSGAAIGVAMSSHTKMQDRLKEAIHSAILEVGRIEGTEESTLTNTDVTEALLEVLGLWAAAYGFEDYAPRDLAMKYARAIEAHIERFGPSLREGRLPIKVIPRRKVN